nr:hypothetical protein [Streptomyces harenosi]
MAVPAAGARGTYDDVAGADHPRRGFPARPTALREGEVTGGAVELFGISAAGLVADALPEERALVHGAGGVVIAGTAHLVGLVDVRPGRAAAAVLALGAPGLLGHGPGRRVRPPRRRAAAAVLRDDLRRREMPGGTGAHAPGAAPGAAIAVSRGRAGPAVRPAV